MQKNSLIEKAKTAERESKNLDFKEEFDIDSQRDWCEVIKDIVAIANSGGGIILFGVKGDGTNSGADLTPLINYDPADITNKIFKYTGVQFADFEIVEIDRADYTAVGLAIGEAFPPMIFIKPGTYPADEGKQKNAFPQGTLYYRHGAKSEPANSDDIETIIEREITKRKKSWLGNIRKVIKAPSDYHVQVLPSAVTISDTPDAIPMNITNEENAHKVKIEEDSLFKTVFTIDYSSMLRHAKAMFSDFKQNDRLHRVMRELKKDPNIHRVRYLDVNNTRGGQKDYYSKKVFDGLAKHFKRKIESEIKN